MNQFDIYVNENELSQSTYPFLIVLQHALINQIDSVIVAPITELSVYANHLPKFSVKVNLFDTEHVVLTQLMSAVHKNELKHFVINKEELHFEIIAALDLLFTGF